MHPKASRYSMCQDINLSSVPSVGQRTGSSFSTTDRVDTASVLTSSMRHPNLNLLLDRSKSGLTARCFSVKKSVLVK